MKRVSKLLVAGMISTGLMCLSFINQPKAKAGVGGDDRSGGSWAYAEIHNAKNVDQKISGEVKFTSEPGGVRVQASVEGLSPGKHGFHIHEFADLSAPDLKSAGGHFNPGSHKHGGPDSEEHHLGDLGNLVADEKGHASLDQIFKGLNIEGKENGVINHSVIIHEKEDDLSSQPAGNAGARIAGGAIQLGKAHETK